MEEEKVKLPKAYKIYLILILIIGLVLIIPLSRGKIFDTLGIFKARDMELKLIADYPIEKDISKIDIYGENIIEWKDNKLSIVDLKGFEIFKKNYKFKEPDLVFGKEIIYIMDKADGRIELLDKDGKSEGQIEFNSSFKKLKEEKEDIHIYKKDGNVETIDIINREGKTLKSHEERIPILTFNIEDENNKYLVSTLAMDEDLSTLVDIYSLEDEEIQSFELKDEIVVYTKFIKNKIIIVTDTAAYVFENAKEKWRKEIKNLKDIGIKGNDLYILYGNKFQILNLRGKVKEEVELKLPLEKIKITDEGILLFGRNDIIIPDSKGNRLNFKTKEDIKDLKYDGGNLLIQIEDRVEIYNIVEKEQK